MKRVNERQKVMEKGEKINKYRMGNREIQRVGEMKKGKGIRDQETGEMRKLKGK